jgi:hypothetical protein
MADERPTDQQLLKAMGLTREELKEALQKFNTFLNTLDAAQRGAFLHSMRSAKDAAREIDDLDVQRLEEFLRSLEPTGQLFFTCTHSGGGGGGHTQS